MCLPWISAHSADELVVDSGVSTAPAELRSVKAIGSFRKKIQPDSSADAKLTKPELLGSATSNREWLDEIAGAPELVAVALTGDEGPSCRCSHPSASGFSSSSSSSPEQAGT